MNWKSWFIVLVGIIFIALLPVGVNGLVSIPVTSEGAATDWIGFYGAYIGGILGGAMTLIGVIITIKAESRKSQEELEKGKQLIQNSIGLFISQEVKYNLKQIKDHSSLWDNIIKNEKDTFQQGYDIQFKYDEFKEVKYELLKYPITDDIMDVFEIYNAFQKMSLYKDIKQMHRFDYISIRNGLLKAMKKYPI